MVVRCRVYPVEKKWLTPVECPNCKAKIEVYIPIGVSWERSVYSCPKCDKNFKAQIEVEHWLTVSGT